MRDATIAVGSDKLGIKRDRTVEIGKTVLVVSRRHASDPALCKLGSGFRLRHRGENVSPLLGEIEQCSIGDPRFCGGHFRHEASLAGFHSQHTAVQRNVALVGRRKFFELADIAAAARSKAEGKASAAIWPLALEAVKRIDALFDI